MQREFWIGCNYWSSNAGSEMWQQWDPDTIRKDLQVLSDHHIHILRVFPNWRDFQPITPIYGASGKIREYRSTNNMYSHDLECVDEKMLTRFAEFCDICDEFGIKIIVGLITGYMSGQIFLPPALYGKNLFTDPFALLCQQRFIRAMVLRFKTRNTILAWDLGNECNNLGKAENVEEATAWSVTMSNAIRAADPTRPILSGMHGLVPGRDQWTPWTIGGQAEACDMLTTHPYPYWVTYADRDPMLSMRTALHGTFETKFYSDIGNRPCLVEELGSMGPMVCSDEAAADFMRINLLSNRIHGAAGVLWWCANEQDALTHTPYTYEMCELELGMRYADGSPKPVLKETKAIAPIVQSPAFDLPKATEDAVCLTTWEQPQWGVAYMTCCLATQAGMHLRYAFANDPLPDASVYLLPSISGASILPREQYLALRQKIYDGATLYISNDNAVLAGFEDLVGLKVTDSCAGEDGTVTVDACTIPFRRSREYRTVPTTATVVSADNKGYPAITKNRYGAGTVIYINFPLEAMLLNENTFTDKQYYKIYRKVFADLLASKPITCDNPYIGLTLHPGENGEILCAAVNYSAEKQSPNFAIKEGFVAGKERYGSMSLIAPFDACIFPIHSK